MLYVFPVFLDQSWGKFLKRGAKLRGDLRANEFFDRRFLFRLRVDVYVELLTTLDKRTQTSKTRVIREHTT